MFRFSITHCNFPFHIHETLPEQITDIKQLIINKYYFPDSINFVPLNSSRNSEKILFPISQRRNCFALHIWRSTASNLVSNYAMLNIIGNNWTRFTMEMQTCGESTVVNWLQLAVKREIIISEKLIFRGEFNIPLVPCNRYFIVCFQSTPSHAVKSFY